MVDRPGKGGSICPGSAAAGRSRTNNHFLKRGTHFALRAGAVRDAKGEIRDNFRTVKSFFNRQAGHPVALVLETKFADFGGDVDKTLFGKVALVMDHPLFLPLVGLDVDR